MKVTYSSKLHNILLHNIFQSFFVISALVAAAAANQVSHQSFNGQGQHFSHLDPTIPHAETSFAHAAAPAFQGVPAFQAAPAFRGAPAFQGGAAFHGAPAFAAAPAAPAFHGAATFQGAPVHGAVHNGGFVNFQG